MPYVEFTSVDDGVITGKAILDDSLKTLAPVSSIEVKSGWERRGVGTSLYRKMQEYAESKGKILTSDFQRSGAAEAWWRKQVSLGKARLAKSGEYYLATGVKF